MPMPSIRTSLAMQLSVAMSLAMALFWLLTTCAALYLDFTADRAAMVERLETQTASVAARQSSELDSAARDLRVLLNSWRSAHVQTAPINHDFLAAQYLPFEADGAPPPPAVARALAFIEAYGSGGIGNLVDSFMLLPTGVVLSTSNGPQHHYSPVPELLRLREAAPREGISWGRPHQGSNGKWRIALAIADPDSKVMIGFTIRLAPDFGTNNLGNVKAARVAWLDANLQPLLPLPELAQPAKFASLGSCQPLYSQRLDGIRTVCAAIEPSGWRLIHYYPASELNRRALASLYRRLPVAVVGLLVLLLLTYAVLQRYLGRPLSAFVEIIDQQADARGRTSAVRRHLPERRDDELGRIAHAYNRLLEAVQTHYAELEAMVHARTVELNEAKQRAELAAAHKSEQITSISHEIRTPLNGIVGALMLLRSTPCDRNQHDLIDTTLKCSAHLLEIIHNMLDFSRIEAGQMLLSPTTVDPLALIDQAMLTVQVAALNKGLALRTEVDANVPASIETDPMRVRQILINLLGNAVKFTQAGEIALRVWADGPHLLLTVRDSGPGIPADRREEIFTPFQQLNVHSPGSGLGLPIARSLARLLGGDLRLLPGELGSCFQLKLPLSEAPAAPPAARGPIEAPPRLHAQLRAWGYQPREGANPELDAPELAYLPARLRHRLDGDGPRPPQDEAEGALPPSAWSLQVLVVDDIDTNRDVIGRMLRQQGHRTSEASSGEAALTLGRGHVYDLVLMDIRMPGLGGTETLARWRNPAFGMLDPDCPVIALTANAQPAERARLLAAGFTEYLTKPVTPDMLARALDLAADLQLARDIELDINTGTQRPVLDTQAGGALRLRADVARLHAQLGAALAAQDRPACLDLLHTLKGLAGQAGLDLLGTAAATWEDQLARGAPLSQAAWIDVGRLIDSELPPGAAGERG